MGSRTLAQDVEAEGWTNPAAQAAQAARGPETWSWEVPQRHSTSRRSRTRPEEGRCSSRTPSAAQLGLVIRSWGAATTR